MDKCKEIIESDCSIACDLKGDVLGTSSMSCVTDKLDMRDKTVEDTNCNLTVLKTKGKIVIDDQENSTSSLRDKSNVVNLHVGPNGLINGLEIENSASFSHRSITDRSTIPQSGLHADSPSSSQISPIHKTPCESNAVGPKLSDRNNDQRTETINSGLISDISSASAVCSSLDLKLLNRPKPASDRPTSTEHCRPNGEASGVSDVHYVSYVSELQMPDIMRLIQKDLSEPYSIYTYRYFIHNWPKLCFLAMDDSKCVGAIVCKLDIHRKVVKRGYIAMLAVDEKYRKKKIGSNLVLKAIRAMVADDADEVVLETEITNRPALRLYENLGFVRDKRLFRYYLNGVDALRLKLWLR